MQTRWQAGSRSTCKPENTRSGIARLMLLLALLCAGIAVVMVSSTAAVPDYDKIYREGFAAAEAGDMEKVAACVAELDLVKDYESHAAMLKGFQEAAGGNLNNALMSFAKGQYHKDTREQSYLQAGLIFYHMKDLNQAIHLLKLTTDINPDNIMAHRVMSAAFYDIGALDRTLEETAHVARLAPEDYHPHLVQGDILKSYGQFQTAVTSYEQAITLVSAGSAGELDVKRGLADCYLKLGRYPQTLELLSSLESTPPVALRQAEAHFYLRHYDEARTLMQSLGRELSGTVEAVVLTVRLLEQEKRYDDAIRILTAILQKEPNNINLLSCAADVYGADGQVEKATQYRERSAEIAELEVEMSKLNHAALNDLQNVELRLQIAAVAEKLGNPKLAGNWIRAAMGISPDDERVQQAWQKFQVTYPYLKKPQTPADASQQR